MTKKKPVVTSEVLLQSIIDGIDEKKGLEVVSLHLANLKSTICDYFIVCHGTSRTHVHAIAESVEEVVKKNTGLDPRRREGLSNAEWILLDYMDVVVHIFQEPVRNFFLIEQLWADAPVKRY